MPQSIRTVSTRVVEAYSKTLTEVALNQNATLPPVKTHVRNTKRVHGRTAVCVLPGFTRGLKSLRTANDVRAHVARYVRIDGRTLQTNEILVFGVNHKTLHGSTRIV